jgi:TPR repeat protein
MKKLILIFIYLFSTISYADFMEAQKLYEHKDFSEAFKEFHKLAKLGNEKSQYNIAFMLSKGEGTEKNLVEAYAWATLVSNNEKYKPLALFIKEQLPEVDMSKAKALSEIYHENYALENSKVILGPIVEAEVDKDNNKINSPAKLVIDAIFSPKFPKRMADKGMRGWVKMLFYLYPDGSIRDIQVIEQLPADGSFHLAAIKSIEQYKMHHEKDGETVKFEYPRAITQRIDFVSKDRTLEFTQKHYDYLNTLKVNAEKGDVNSQYEYAVLQEKYKLNKGIDQKQINEWLFNASQEGIADAQYRLGMNIYNGKACRVEKQKGLDWIFHSAQIGNAYAQYTAYKMLKNETVINRTSQEPIYWLEEAARNGLSIAQLNYANEISRKQNPTKEELMLAEKYANNYAKETYKTIQWYQVSAMIEDKLNNPSKALKKIKTALRLAKKYDWDLTELKQQQIMFAEHKNS